MFCAAGKLANVFSFAQDATQERIGRNRLLCGLQEFLAGLRDNSAEGCHVVTVLESSGSTSESQSDQGLSHVGEHLGESFPVLQQVFLAGLRDSSAEVRRTALQAVGAMVPWLEEQPHINLFKDLVPLTIQVCFDCIVPSRTCRRWGKPARCALIALFSHALAVNSSA